MSLLRRVERNRKPKQILNLLLARLYPDANQLKQDIRAILDARSSLTDSQENDLDATPHEFVIGFRPHNPNLPIRELLDKLQAQEDLAPHIQAIVAEENIELTDAETEFMSYNPVGYLMGIEPPRHLIPPSRDMPHRELHDRIKMWIMNEIHNLPGGVREDKEGIRQQIEDTFNAYLEKHELELSRAERQRLFEGIVNDLIGFGALEPLLSDEAITEIRLLGPKNIWVVRNGKLEKSAVQFDNFDHIYRIIDRMIAPLGKRHDEAMPLTQVRLPDGSYLSIIHSVIANNGPILTIFKRNRKPLVLRDLIQFGTLTDDMAKFLRVCVLAECNILVTGLPATGKSVLLNVLGNFIRHDEFIVTIEESEELMLQQEAVACLHTRPGNIENKGAITQQHLLAHVQSMRPERILIGEVNGEEVFDLLTTVVPWMTTLRARDPEDALYQLEPLYLMADEKRPIQAVHSRIAERVDLIVHMERLQTGYRKLSSISEVDYVDDQYQVRPIFQFELLPPDEEGFRTGIFHAVNRPTERFLRRIGQFTNNDELIESIFGGTP